ncbi:hypothetical protein D3C76_542080 [compost metagenome]
MAGVPVHGVVLVEGDHAHGIAGTDAVAIGVHCVGAHGAQGIDVAHQVAALVVHMLAAAQQATARDASVGPYEVGLLHQAPQGVVAFFVNQAGAVAGAVFPQDIGNRQGLGQRLVVVIVAIGSNLAAGIGTAQHIAPAIIDQANDRCNPGQREVVQCVSIDVGLEGRQMLLHGSAEQVVAEKGDTIVRRAGHNAQLGTAAGFTGEVIVDLGHPLGISLPERIANPVVFVACLVVAVKQLGRDFAEQVVGHRVAGAFLHAIIGVPVRGADLLAQAVIAVAAAQGLVIVTPASQAGADHTGFLQAVPSDIHLELLRGTCSIVLPDQMPGGVVQAACDLGQAHLPCPGAALFVDHLTEGVDPILGGRCSRDRCLERADCAGLGGRPRRLGNQHHLARRVVLGGGHVAPRIGEGTQVANPVVGIAANDHIARESGHGRPGGTSSEALSPVGDVLLHGLHQAISGVVDETLAAVIATGLGHRHGRLAPTGQRRGVLDPAAEIAVAVVLHAGEKTQCIDGTDALAGRVVIMDRADLRHYRGTGAVARHQGLADHLAKGVVAVDPGRCDVLHG